MDDDLAGMVAYNGAPTACNNYTFYERSCVIGYNLDHLYESDKSVEECADICNTHDDCMAFEYGMNHAGYADGPFPERECRPQSRNEVARLSLCGYNLNLYVKQFSHGICLDLACTTCVSGTSRTATLGAWSVPRAYTHRI